MLAVTLGETDSARHVYVVFIILSVISVDILKFKLSLCYILFACEICLPSWQDLHLCISFMKLSKFMNRAESYFHFLFQLPASYLGSFVGYCF